MGGARVFNVLNRRGFLGTLAALVAAPFAPLPTTTTTGVDLASSGAAASAVSLASRDPTNPGNIIVTIQCDTTQFDALAAVVGRQIHDAMRRVPRLRT